MQRSQEGYTFSTDAYKRKGKWIRYRTDRDLAKVRRVVNLSACDMTDTAEYDFGCVLEAIERAAEGLIDPGVILESHPGKPIKLTIIGWRTMTQKEVSHRDLYKQELAAGNRRASEANERRERTRLRELLERFPDEPEEV